MTEPQIQVRDETDEVGEVSEAISTRAPSETAKKRGIGWTRKDRSIPKRRRVLTKHSRRRNRGPKRKRRHKR